MGKIIEQGVDAIMDSIQQRFLSKNVKKIKEKLPAMSYCNDQQIRELISSKMPLKIGELIE